MKFNTLKTLLGTAATLALFAATGLSAQAGTLYNNWNYAIDSFQDGVDGSVLGSKSRYEFYGMAVRETSDRVYFAINSHLNPNGQTHSGALNGKISYGDLFLNFHNPTNFNSANGNLYAIRFDASNDTGVKLGLYNHAQAISLTTANKGFVKTADHTNFVNSPATRGGAPRGSASYADLAANTTYFNSQQAAPTTLKSGSFLGGISSMLSQAELTNLGLDFTHFNAAGKYTFGFSVDRALLPEGSFVASLFAECGNDGMALTGDLKGVPEPSAIAGLVTAVGLVGGGLRRRRRGSIA